VKRTTFYALSVAGFAFAGFWFPWCRLSACFFTGVLFEVAL